MNAEKTDHKAEALRLLGEAGEESGKLDGGDRDYVEQLRAEALVHSNLAIAEGQERVAEELSKFNKRFESILAHSPNTQFGSDKRYLKVKP